MKHLTKTQRKHQAERQYRKGAKRVAIIARREIKLKKQTIKKLAKLKEQFAKLEMEMAGAAKATAAHDHNHDVVEGLEAVVVGDEIIGTGQQEQTSEISASLPVIDAVIEE